ncbi:MAG: phosphoglucomutase/phosphomannomutase PgmG [Alphaproteobacteria bacterium]
MSAGHSFHPTVLREYDIRGIVGETLSEDDACAVGRAFATLMQRRGAGRRVCVGYDGRLSSPAFEAALVEGLVAAGSEAVRIGLGPTPMLYFSVFHLATDGGIVVTGSHNPPDQNGFKMMIGRKAFFGDDIAELGRVAAEGDYASGEGRVEDRPVFDDYVARLAADYTGERALKVAWDAGNGAAGEAMARLTERLPGTHLLLNEAIDGTFPVHHPDPTLPENLAQLIDTVRAQGCDLGVAFDGDGDRIGIVDEHGRILWGDQLMAIFAADVLGRRPGATIIADVKASQVLFDEIARLRGTPLMWRSGHSLIKSKMVETGSPLAGEMSGHIFFADGYYGFDDALYAAVRLLSIVARAGESLGAMRDRLPAVVNTPELRFACAEQRKFVVVDEIRRRLDAAGADFSDIDGVRVKTPDGWWLLRASNTQAVLVARCEAYDEAGLARLKADLAVALEASGITPPEF